MNALAGERGSRAKNMNHEFVTYIQSLTVSQAYWFIRLLMVLIDINSMINIYDIRQMSMKTCFRVVCVNSLTWTLVWLAPGGTRNSVFVCFYVLPQDYWSNGRDWPNDPEVNE